MTKQTQNKPVVLGEKFEREFDGGDELVRGALYHKLPAFQLDLAMRKSNREIMENLAEALLSRSAGMIRELDPLAPPARRPCHVI